MAESGEAASTPVAGTPAWLRFITLMVLLIAAGLAFWLYATDSNRTRSGDMGAVREVSIVATNFRSWPDTAHQVAKTNLFHAGSGGRLSLYHPEIGRFAITYSTTAPAPPPQAGQPPADDDKEAKGCTPSIASRCVDIVDGKMTVRGVALDAPPATPDPYYNRVVAQQQVLPAGTSGPIYYAIRDLPLESVLSLPDSFEHVLIVNGASVTADDDKLPPLKVVAQIGRPEIPVRSLNELPRLRDQTVQIAEAAAKLDSTGSAANLVSALGQQSAPDALVPVDSRIAGRPYRLYLYPVSIAATDRTIDFYVVGIAPARGGLFDVDFTGAAALAFALALAMLLALTPVIKLAFLGPVDGIRRLELSGIFAGLILATAIAAAALILAWDVISARSAARQAMVVQADRLAGAMHGELAAQLKAPMNPTLALLRPDPARATTPGRIITGSADRNTDLPQPNTFFFLDGRGRQSLDTPIVARRDQPGADFDVADRAYFRRALVGEEDPGSAALGATAMSGPCRPTSGFVVEQIRSRPDGVAKTVVAVPVRPATVAASVAAYEAAAGTEKLPATAPERVREAVTDRLDFCSAAAAQSESEARVMVLSFVMSSMISPATEAGSSFAVVDLGEPDWPVIFHLRRGRAHVEYLESGLDDAARDSLAMLAATEPTGADCKAGVIHARPIAGSYEGADSILAAARVPCTRWAVISAADQDLADRAAGRAALNATIIWLGLAFLGGIAIACLYAARRRIGIGNLAWLWPDEARRDSYRRLSIGGAAAGGLALLLALIGFGQLALLLAAAASIWLLYDLHKPVSPVTAPLSEVTERRFRNLMLTLLLLLAAAPMLALATDARGHFRSLGAAAQTRADQNAHQRAAAEQASITRVFRTAWRDKPIPAAPQPEVKANPPLPFSLTAEARRLAMNDDGSVAWASAGGQLRGNPNPPAMVFLLLFAGILAGLILLSVHTVGRSLFGFGIALEAVDYPRFLEETGGLLRRVKMETVRPCFMAIGAPSWVRQSLITAAGPDNAYDLYEATASADAAAKVKLPAAAKPPALLLLYDFELLFRDSARRQTALSLIERLLVEQRKQPDDSASRIGLLADLSPLDRFLQSSEHRETSDADSLRSRWQSAEDIRWSRILEQFTNYVYRAAPRPTDGLELEKETAAVRLVVDELAYLPDHVVQAIIPDTTIGLQAAEIVSWAKTKNLDLQTEAAIVDFLASQLIEHYHYLWSVSSRAEQILIYRFAHGQLVNIAEAYALRSLVRRGIVVLDPVPRIMNRSFAQFVRHVEEPKRLKMWQESQPDGLWTRLKAPLTLVLPLLIAFFVLLMIEGANSFVSTVPLLLAAGPAVLNMIGGFRRSFG
ncbi:hypothetical protein [Sandaracinobacteroides hominis]|uniref:hypothetical protein n=1 Tax=Sandaracinobacteroides hominis TaxID=2780086 RepID=UPI0018F66F51|nr:hypothetical protein [Sandaracinobacteroides hominis]